MTKMGDEEPQPRRDGVRLHGQGRVDSLARPRQVQQSASLREEGSLEGEERLGNWGGWQRGLDSGTAVPPGAGKEGPRGPKSHTSQRVEASCASQRVEASRLVREGLKP